MSDKPSVNPLPADRRYWTETGLTVFARRNAYPLPEVIRATGGDLTARPAGNDQPSDQGFECHLQAGEVKPAALI